MRIQPFSFLSPFALDASSKKKRVSEVEVFSPPLPPLPHPSKRLYASSLPELCRNVK
jgi:hypothetical protein